MLQRRSYRAICTTEFQPSRRYQHSTNKSFYQPRSTLRSTERAGFMLDDANDETRYIVTLYTNAELHDKVTLMRQKYFPKHLNKLQAHLTLFHALPESKLQSDIIPMLQSVTADTTAFEITAGPPFQMNKGIGISVPRAKGGQLARDVHEALLKTWSRAGFLSEQDSRHSGVHYTIMNKVDDHAEVNKALAKVKLEWSETSGTALGLSLWQYDRGYWKGERAFPFKTAQ